MTDAGITLDQVVDEARVVVASRQGAYACVAIKSDLPGPDRQSGWVGGCNRFSAPDEIVGAAVNIVQVRPGVWVVAAADSEGSLRRATVWLEGGDTLAFESIKEGTVVVGSIEGSISCVEITSSKYATMQAWPPFDGSDDRDFTLSCPAYTP